MVGKREVLFLLKHPGLTRREKRIDMCTAIFNDKVLSLVTEFPQQPSEVGSEKHLSHFCSMEDTLNFSLKDSPHIIISKTVSRYFKFSC